MIKIQDIYTEKLIKIKTKLLILSGISLFVGLTETLPTKIALLGLDFSENQNILGWFILFSTIYFFVYFCARAFFEYFNQNLNLRIDKASTKLSGKTIGLTYGEVKEQLRLESIEQELHAREDGSFIQEVSDLNEQREQIATNKSTHVETYNKILDSFFEIVIPLLFSVTSIVYLYNFLTIPT